MNSSASVITCIKDRCLLGKENSSLPPFLTHLLPHTIKILISSAKTLGGALQSSSTGLLQKHIQCRSSSSLQQLRLFFPGVDPQNHRTVRIGRDLCGSSSPTPCRSRVTQSRLHRTLSRWVLNISREGDSTAPLGNLFQCSVTLRVKKFFLGFRWNFPGFSLCPFSLVLLLGTTGKSLAPSS